MNATEPAGQHAAGEEVAQLARDEARQAFARVIVGNAGEECLEVLSENSVQNGGLGVATAPDSSRRCHTREWQRGVDWLRSMGENPAVDEPARTAGL